MRSTAWSHWQVSCSMMQSCVCVCVCVCVCTHQPCLVSARLVSAHLPAYPGSSVWMGEAGHQCLQLAKSGAIPKPVCFPSSPLCRPSSLFLFLFCCCFNSSSGTFSVLPERYLVSSPRVAPFTLVLHSSHSPAAGQRRTVFGSSGQTVTVSTTACSVNPGSLLPCGL